MRALVVGYGHMGHIHAKVLADLGYAITTVDPDPARSADYATIADATMRDPWLPPIDKFDVAAVACPPEHLVESAFQLAGTPMLVEKPFATNERDAAMLGAYLQRAGVPVCVGFVERFNPQVRALRKRMAQGEIRVKRAHLVRLSDRPSPDVTLDLLTHDVDLATHLELWRGDVTFDTRADQPEKVRRIEITAAGDYLPGTTERGPDQEIVVDLMDHSLSPLHALWHAFLTGEKVPGPDDALRTLQRLQYASQPAPA